MSYPGKSTFFKGKFKRNSNTYVTNFLLDSKLKIENAEMLTSINMNKNNDIQQCVPQYSKTIVHYKFPCFEGQIVLNISDVVL